MNTRADAPAVGLFVRPLDVLLFRDGRPFTAGVDRLAQGLFPPLPTTFYGAFRGALLAHHGARFAAGQIVLPKDWLDGEVAPTLFENPKSFRDDPKKLDPSALGTLALTHFSLAHCGAGGLTPLYPLPLDVLRYSRKGEAGSAPPPRRARPRPFATPAGVRTSLPGGLLPVLPHHSERHYYEHREGLLDRDAFRAYLLGETPEPAGHEDPEPATRPSEATAAKGEQARHTDRHARTSVAIGEKRTAEEGALFAVEFAAFRRDVGFALRFAHAPGLPARGLLKLGGESRMASFEPADVPALAPPDGLAARLAKHCTLVLLTPAPFAAGWRPDFLRDDLTGVLGRCRVKLVGAAVGRPVNVGGWDMQANRPKAARRAAPAGSVYFFELTDDAADVGGLLACFGQSVCRQEHDRNQGLGLAALGAWTPDDREATP